MVDLNSEEPDLRFYRLRLNLTTAQLGDGFFYSPTTDTKELIFGSLKLRTFDSVAVSVSIEMPGFKSLL